MEAVWEAQELRNELEKERASASIAKSASISAAMAAAEELEKAKADLNLANVSGAVSESRHQAALKKGEVATAGEAFFKSQAADAVAGAAREIERENAPRLPEVVDKLEEELMAANRKIVEVEEVAETRVVVAQAEEVDAKTAEKEAKDMIMTALEEKTAAREAKEEAEKAEVTARRAEGKWNEDAQGAMAELEKVKGELEAVKARMLMIEGRYEAAMKELDAAIGLSTRDIFTI